ncbi:Non-specific serine/threonine protein kinase [Bertholletia excelsa]
MAMERLHRCRILFSGFLLLQFSSLDLLSASDCTPAKQYFINCGSKSNIEEERTKRLFTGDEKLRGSVSFSRGSSKDADKNPTGNSFGVYQTARIFKRPSFYKFQIDGPGTYMVRLHFFAFSSHNNLSDAQFGVSASGFSLLPNFTVENRDSFAIKEFLITTDEKELQICFTPSGRNPLAFVNALEVFLTPKSFISHKAPHIEPAGESSGEVIATVLGTILRVNVGGEEIKSEDDSLWRTWVTDDAYLLNQNYKNKSKPVQPDYQTGNATNCTAPKNVYLTARYLDTYPSRLAWRFNVSKDRTHFVRLHFCDIVSPTLNVDNFTFSIYENFSRMINPYVLYPEKWYVPFSLDFVLDSDKSGFLNIGISTNGEKKYAFLNGLEIMEARKDPGLVCAKDEPENKPLSLILGLSVGGAALIFITLTVLLIIKPRKVNSSGFANLNLELKIPFAEIKRATDNFNKRRLIGEGGFGKVYRGTLRNGLEVAVKRGEGSHGQGLLEFQNEITILSKIRHRHLVSLIGYCDERSEMILVYEFMENGTLRTHLYDSHWSSKRLPYPRFLSWKQRIEICIGSAEGLHYLHTSSDAGIIHRDVKSTNILLDRQFVAKVSDFGISKSGHLDQNYVSTNVKGSVGYLDPEYFGTQQLTKKSDMYSFGMVLLEVLCARPPINTSLPGEQANLGEWAMDLYKRGEIEKAVDERIVSEVNPSALRKFMEIVEKCLSACGAERPQMGDVLWDLKYVLELQLVVNREPYEESSTASFQLPRAVFQSLPSCGFSVDKDDEIRARDEGSDTTASEVFTQLRLADPR